MDALHAMEYWATGNRLLSDIGFNPRVPRTPMFADAALVFFKSFPTDHHVISSPLGLFGDGSGLRVNLSKCSVTYIRCEDSLADSMVTFLSCKLISATPCGGFLYPSIRSSVTTLSLSLTSSLGR
ncbi:hypothetical protein D1007_08843 [Hordeum vulgare]|nr:hypothetical protein D1007_08843 [Hordeum vulgare]